MKRGAILLKIAVIDDGIDSAYINPIIVESLEVRNKCVIHCSEVRGITHGTKCAKVLWLAAENDFLELVSIKILKDSTDRGEIDDLVIALEWCYNNKIKLINLSAGSNRYIDKIKLLPVVKKIYEKGIIVAACNNSNTLTYPASLNGVIGVKCDKSEIIPAGNYFYNSNDIRNVEVTVGSISDIPKFSELDLEKHNSFVAPYITGIISKMLLNGKEIGEIQKRLVDGSIAFNCTFNFEECNMNKAFFANPFIIALKSNRELDLGKLVIGLRKEGYEATAITYNSYSGKRDEEFCFEYWVNMFDITIENFLKLVVYITRADVLVVDYEILRRVKQLSIDCLLIVEEQKADFKRINYIKKIGEEKRQKNTYNLDFDAPLNINEKDFYDGEQLLDYILFKNLGDYARIEIGYNTKIGRDFIKWLVLELQ